MDHYTERGDQEDRYEDDWNRKRGRMRGDYNREIWSNDWSRREYGSYGSQGQGYLGQNQGDYGNYGRGSSNEYDAFDQVSGIKDVQNQIQVKQQIEGNRSNEGQGNESQPQQQQTRKKQATA